MVMKRIIRTSNKELYNKLNSLIFDPEVVLNNIKPQYIKQIINNINKHKNMVVLERINDYEFKLKRKHPLDILVYFVKK
jgi:hypothetical protein